MEISDEDKGLINLMGRTLKDIGKQVDESSEKKYKRRKRHRDKMAKEINVRKALKKALKDEEKRDKRVADEAKGGSTSLASARGIFPEGILM